ncbi:Blastomyces -phase-specific protein [Moelleriella libera RCEF 2490]|uniref:Blastomyces-phase-specific protein n=1 Tax=Moelleriella libera RCEF 2490 TaxID=1081109 RepID=A0A167YT31_9HYPO|nr:Blastomyces -phase-specific protein [Moelleriella libera RCEF 2490]
MFDQTNKALTTAVALAGAVSGIGHAVVKNGCSFPVTVWSVGSQVSPAHTLHTGEFYSEQFAWDNKTGGRALKVTHDPDGLYTGEPQVIFAYSLKDEQVWYDLSSVFGDAFSGLKLVEGSADTSCPSIVWPQGTSPAGSQVKTCQNGANVTLSLCSS